MTWADFYLICFVVGFLLSVVMFLLGSLNLHIPHVHVPISGGHSHVGMGHDLGHGTGDHGGVTDGARAPGGHTHIPAFNLITLTAFLAWFGGTGYLLAQHSTIWFLAALGLSLVSGAGGAAIIYLFLARVLTSPDEALDPADFEMAGVLGKLVVPIREGGTGELIYSQGGTRRVCAARSDNGTAILKGTEVVVTRYERGIAYVRRWSELAGEEGDVGEAASANGGEEITQ